MMKKMIIVIMLVLLIVLIFVISRVYLINDVNTYENNRFRWGRDTVKQWKDGKFELIRSPSMYCFRSYDNMINICKISRYYDDGAKVYFVTEDNFYVCVNIEDGTKKEYDMIEKFDDNERYIFGNKEFIDLFIDDNVQSIWDILKNK